MRMDVLKWCCPKPDCQLDARYSEGNVVRHSFIKLKHGRRRRYRLACPVVLDIPRLLEVAGVGITSGSAGRVCSNR